MSAPLSWVDVEEFEESCLQSCEYEGGHTITVYQGRYRFDVYEARTGRRVGSFTVDGTTDAGECAEWTLVRRDNARDVSYDTKPDDAGYAVSLAPLVNSDAGG